MDTVLPWETSLLISLENSRSFARTHEMIEKLSRYNTWSSEELELLFRIAVTNSQVKYIINDSDVKLFYSRILRGTKRLTENAKAVKEMLEHEE